MCAEKRNGANLALCRNAKYKCCCFAVKKKGWRRSVSRLIGYVKFKIAGSGAKRIILKSCYACLFFVETNYIFHIFACKHNLNTAL